MGKLKRLSGEIIVKALQRLGFQPVRQRGSHVVMKKVLADGAVGCVVPMHREVAVGTLYNILKLARVTQEEFEEQL
jgi:predicted RNA binding protein YcfA (HicA-like mRNA interferase family)